MEFFELMDISHKYLEILNPSSREKILAVGDVLNLNADSRVIDFGSGKGELLALWAYWELISVRRPITIITRPYLQVILSINPGLHLI